MATPLYETIGAELDAAKRSLPKPPGVLQRRQNPALMDTFTAHQAKIADLQAQYEGALGSPGAARLGMTSSGAPSVSGAVLPTLQSGYGAAQADVRRIDNQQLPGMLFPFGAKAAGLPPTFPNIPAVPTPVSAGLGATPKTDLAAAPAAPQYNLPVNQATTGSITNEGVTVNGQMVSNAAADKAPPAPSAGLGAAPVRMVSALQHDAMLDGAPRPADFGLPDRNTRYTPRTAAGGFFQGGMGVKQIVGDNALQAGYAKLGADFAARREANDVSREGHRLTYGATTRGQDITAQGKEAQMRQDVLLKGPGAMKDSVETKSIQERQRIAAAEPDPIKRAAILAGHNPPDPRLQSPPNMQPMPGDKDQSAVTFDPRTGTYTRVPIRTQIRGAVGTNGKYYKIDAAGKQVEMTPAEKAQFTEQKRGLGAVQ